MTVLAQGPRLHCLPTPDILARHLPGVRVRGVLADLDGTLLAGGQALPGAVDFVRRFADRLAVVSNDAEHEPAELANVLADAGMAVRPECIVLAGAIAVDRVAAQWPGGRVLLLGSATLARRAARKGLVVIDREGSGSEWESSPCDVVLVARDRAFSFARLKTAANAVRAGAAIVVANPDLTHPGPRGTLVPETGALLQALLACTGPKHYEVIGKPEPALFEAGLELLGIAPSEALMVGDNSLTDGRGAERLGIAFWDATCRRGPVCDACLDTA